MRRCLPILFLLLLAAQESGGAEPSRGRWRNTYWTTPAPNSGSYVLEVNDKGFPKINSPLRNLTFTVMPRFESGRQADPDFDEIATWTGAATPIETYAIQPQRIDCLGSYRVEFRLKETHPAMELEVTIYWYVTAEQNQETRECKMGEIAKRTFTYTKETKPPKMP